MLLIAQSCYTVYSAAESALGNLELVLQTRPLAIPLLVLSAKYFDDCWYPIDR